ncbi:MAG: 50S ribosomal protein L22 [Deltaproteobacteria bacterium]|nr:50S ribosomal protein L22 [Deltaproteobacteria bacterium]
MVAKAKLRFLRISPRKVKIVTDLIKGKKATEAINILKFTPNAAARPVLKLLNSAIANATNNQRQKINVDDLIVKQIIVGNGPIMKRIMPRARGTAYRINKRMSHITIFLDNA